MELSDRLVAALPSYYSVLNKAQVTYARIYSSKKSTLCSQPASRSLPESSQALSAQWPSKHGPWDKGYPYCLTWFEDDRVSVSLYLFPQPEGLAQEAPGHITLLVCLSCKACWEHEELGTRRKLKAGDTTWRDPPWLGPAPHQPHSLNPQLSAAHISALQPCEAP